MTDLLATNVIPLPLSADWLQPPHAAAFTGWKVRSSQ